MWERNFVCTMTCGDFWARQQMGLHIVGTYRTLARKCWGTNYPSQYSRGPPHLLTFLGGNPHVNSVDKLSISTSDLVVRISNIGRFIFAPRPLHKV